MCPLPLRCFSDQAACQCLGITQVTTAILKYLSAASGVIFPILFLIITAWQSVLGWWLKSCESLGRP